jgi:hypothetical protein
MREIEQVASSDEDFHSGIRQHVSKPLAWICRIQGQIGPAGSHDPEQGNYRLQRALHAEPHRHFRTAAQLDQPMRQLVCPAVQFAVGEYLVLKHERDGVGRFRCLRCNQIMHALVLRIVGGGAAAFGGEPTQFRRA